MFYSVNIEYSLNDEKFAKYLTVVLNIWNIYSIIKLFYTSQEPIICTGRKLAERLYA